MRIRPLFLLLAPLLVLGVAYPAYQQQQGRQAKSSNYERLRPSPKEVHERLSGYKVSLSEAITIAEAAVGGGKAASAFLAEGKQPTYTITAFTEREAQTFVVDARNGAIRSQQAIPRFPGEPVEGEWTELESGLKYFDLRVGHGALPAGTASTVRVHYTGYLVNGVKFDSSRDRGRATTFALDRVIPGWREGVLTMRVGGKRKLIVPPVLGYGDRGNPPTVPGKATLIFDIELIDIVSDGPEKEKEEGK